MIKMVKGAWMKGKVETEVDRYGSWIIYGEILSLIVRKYIESPHKEIDVRSLSKYLGINLSVPWDVVYPFACYHMRYLESMNFAVCTKRGKYTWKFLNNSIRFVKRKKYGNKKIIYLINLRDD